MADASYTVTLPEGFYDRSSDSAFYDIPGYLGLPPTSPQYVGGIKVSDIVSTPKPSTPQNQTNPAATGQRLTPQINASQRFWSSPPRPITYPYGEGIVVAFNKLKTINYLAMDLPAFPHHFFLYWWDNDSQSWKEFTGPSGGVLRIYIDGSTPAVVGTAAAYQAHQHPSHYGAGHWLHYDLDINCVTTDKIKLMGNRNFGTHLGGPVDPQGNPAPYSLGIRNFDFGCRCRNKEDIPLMSRDPDIITEREAFTQTIDLCGCPVELKVRENRAADLLQGQIWKSEAMPVPYAVVNFYVDARDDAGNAQVIDRFNLTPLSSGPTLNLYYATEVPDTDFGASDDPIVFPNVLTAGTNPPTNQSDGLCFKDEPSYLTVSNSAVQWDPSKPWWIGIEFQPQWNSTNVNTPHIIYDTGAIQLAWNAGAFQLTVGDGTIQMQSFDFTANSQLHAIAAYDGERISFYVPEAKAVMNGPADLTGMTSNLIRFGAEEGASTAPVIFTGNFRMNAFVIKQELTSFVSDTDDVFIPIPMQKFIADANGYLDKPAFARDSDGSTDNALLRYLPRFVCGDTVNPYGFQGGPGDIYAEIVWTPVARDYKLRAGMLQFHPVRAKFFKFEFSCLVCEPYNTYIPMTRTVRTYSQAATYPNNANPQLTTQISQSATSPGLTANLNATMETVRYADTPQITAPSTDDILPTEAITSRDPGIQQKLDDLGSMYRFQSWQAPNVGPVYAATSKHYYETVDIQCSNQCAYFVGLSGIEMYRVDYAADDDTDQYIDLFDDLANVDPDYLTPTSVIGTTNLVTNPSFENGTTGYTLYTNGTATGGALSTAIDPAPAVGGANAAKVAATTLGNATTDRVGWQSTYATPDFDYSVAYSIYARKVTGNATLRLSVEYYTAGATLIFTDTRTFTPTTTYDRYSAIWLPPENTASIKVYWWLEAGGAAAVEYHLDGYQIENLHLTDYYDGSMPGGQWNGTTNASTSTRTNIDINPWGWDGDKLFAGSSLEPVTTVSKRFPSKRKVRAIQFASQQSNSVQLVPDPDFLSSHLEDTWLPLGDVISMEISSDIATTLGNSVKVLRSSSINTWGELRENYPTWGSIPASNNDVLLPSYWQLEGDPTVVGYGGIKLRNPVQISEANHITAAARVYADHALATPLTLQITSPEGDILAEATQQVRAGSVVEWFVDYTITPTSAQAKTWGDIMRLDPSPVQPSYGALFGNTWGDFTSTDVSQSRQVGVQIIQQGAGEDTWYVDSLALFEDPILWEFSNDSGSSWWPALGIRNNPRGVLVFPDITNAATPGLKWRVTGYRPNLHISALDIRPWYAENLFGIPHREPGVSGGPNIQPTDHYPPIEEDAFFQQWSNSVPQDWYYVYRQLLQLNRETVTVSTEDRPIVFLNLFSAMVKEEPIPPIPPYLDPYQDIYEDMYGVPNPDA